MNHKQPHTDYKNKLPYQTSFLWMRVTIRVWLLQTGFFNTTTTPLVGVGLEGGALNGTMAWEGNEGLLTDLILALYTTSLCLRWSSSVAMILADEVRVEGARAL